MVVCTGVKYNAHEEIVYDYGQCPLCLSLEELDSVKTQLHEAEDSELALEKELEGRVLGSAGVPR